MCLMHNELQPGRGRQPPAEISTSKPQHRPFKYDQHHFKVQDDINISQSRHESDFRCEYNIQNNKSEREERWHRQVCHGCRKGQLWSTSLPSEARLPVPLTEMCSLRPESCFQNKHYRLPVRLVKAPTVRGSHCGDFLKFQQSPRAHRASHWQWQCSWKFVWGANQWAQLWGCWGATTKHLPILPVLALKSHHPTTPSLRNQERARESCQSHIFNLLCRFFCKGWGWGRIQQESGERAKQFLLSTPNYYLPFSEILWSTKLQKGKREEKKNKKGGKKT